MSMFVCVCQVCWVVHLELRHYVRPLYKVYPHITTYTVCMDTVKPLQLKSKSTIHTTRHVLGFGNYRKVTV